MTTTTPSLATKLLEAIRGGQAPGRARLAAARGALPLAPAELAVLQVLLLSDPDDAIRNSARQSLDEIDPAVVAELATEADTPPAVLEWIVGQLPRWPESGALLARRADLSSDLGRTLAACDEAATLEALAGNFVALSHDPEIGRLLRSNPSLPRAALHRLLDHLEEIAKEEARHAEPTEEDDPGSGTDADPPQLQPATDPFLAALGVDAEVEALLPSLGLDLGRLAERSELLCDTEELDDEGLIKRLSRMNVGQKLRLALFGGKEERTILVRDSNRIVAAAVIKNPKFTEQEADAVAKSRNVSDEVLRLIGRNKEFARNPKIQLSLIHNPRTPVELAMHFLPQRNDRELKMLFKNRNVADVVRRQAKKIFDAREARRRVRLRPKTH
ncbi:MAG: hypothetical protein Q9Q40_10745 [Acidobacteriota bacterium]|nr:hypothetical protein [Acidobacteriota bacterium]MDQ7088032.1 hypothetical protein [Acidobacteriota bacterium]